MDRASPLNLHSPAISCPGCGAELKELAHRHVCPACHEPLPVRSQEDYFAVFGLEPSFSPDLSVLEKRFYEISRVLHPDRFSAAKPEVRNRSLERMSLLNQAYQTLKNSSERRAYRIAQAGISVPKSGQSGPGGGIPELAEAWFELQDFLSDATDPTSATAKLEQFGRELAETRVRRESEMRELERAYDQSQERALLEKLAQRIQTEAYLQSMQRDFERIKQRYLA